MPDADAGDAARPGTPDTEYPSKKVDEARMKADALEREHLAVTMQRRHDALREELKSAREALEKTTQENARVVLSDLHSGLKACTQGPYRDSLIRNTSSQP